MLKPSCRRDNLVVVVVSVLSLLCLSLHQVAASNANTAPIGRRRAYFGAFFSSRHSSLLSSSIFPRPRINILSSFLSMENPREIIATSRKSRFAVSQSRLLGRITRGPDATASAFAGIERMASSSILWQMRGGSNASAKDNKGNTHHSKKSTQKGTISSSRKDEKKASSSSRKATKKSVAGSRKKTIHNDQSDIFQLVPMTSSSSSSSSNSMNPMQHIRVTALLKTRDLPWKFGLQILLVGMTVVQAYHCSETAGIPRRQAIWSYLLEQQQEQQAHHFENVDLDRDNIQHTMPHDFTPTPLQTFVASQLARIAKNVLPPSALPSGRPLLSLVECGLVLLVGGTMLLPHWFLSVQLWYDYQQQQQPTSTTSQKNAAENFQPTAVLLQMGPQHDDHHDDSSKPTSKRRKHRYHNNQRVICQLRATSSQLQAEDNPPPFYFEHYHKRYYYDPHTNQCWDGGPNLQISVGNLVEAATSTSASSSEKETNKFVGLFKDPSQLAQAQDRWFTYNHQTTVPIPTLAQALAGRLRSPLVVIQLLGKAMAVLEAGKVGALMALAVTVAQHFQNARSSILSSRTLQQDVAGLAEEFASAPVWVYRDRHWKPNMVASDLVPGDLFLLSSSSSTSSKATNTTDAKGKKISRHTNVIIPVDALLLDGVCVTMEAVLTGETVPQTKMPIDSTTVEWNQTLDMTGSHRSAVLFAGTTLLHCTPSLSSPLPTRTSENRIPEGVPCLALRTGSYSSKGELIAALTSSRSKAGVATISNPQFDRDALRLISSMSLLAVLACASLFWKSPTAAATTTKISGFRRVLQCTRIATSCIPSDLPLSLSSVVQNCANVLRQEADVVCSQPGALLTSSQIDTIVFDKTGTLTADTQSLAKVTTFTNDKTKHSKNKSKGKGKGAKKVKDPEVGLENMVLAGCHSLVHVQETGGASFRLVGDPLELAALEFSGWGYNQEEGYYHPRRTNDKKNIPSSGIEKLWQIKVFPFNPTARLSSAICLARHSDGSYKLWAVLKGAPESVQPLLSYNEGPKGGRFGHWYDKKMQSLEVKGYRVIGMGIKEIKTFNSTTHNESESSMIAQARTFASNLHRSDIEANDGSALFCGFACFNAFLRPSSKRILQELKVANVKSIMLTGDGMRSAGAVATNVGIIRPNSNLAVLEESSSGGDDVSTLVWRLTLNDGKRIKEKIRSVTSKSIQRILEENKRGETTLISSGGAMKQLILNARENVTYRQLADKLGSFSAIARASPSCKEMFVEALRKTGRRVLMCGDGVNDVSAMKEAEVSVALLNGFGAESGDIKSTSKDTEDEHRRLRIQNKVWGKSTAKKKSAKSSDGGLESLGVGSSVEATNARFRRRVEAAQAKITKQAAARHGMEWPTDQPVPYSFSDIKEMISLIFHAIMEERRRAVKLKKGGGEAAAILAEEDILMKRSASGKTVGNATVSISKLEIQPGEACMASPFSCLRSSIDGVEAVLRAGIATAACALSIQQKITMNSLMSCFNLSALYRDGLRYSESMAGVEVFLYMLVDIASYQESCKMRPRLPRSKRPSSQSLFKLQNIFSVITQVAIHLIFTEFGIVFAKEMEKQAGGSVPAIKQLIKPSPENDRKHAALLGVMAKLASSQGNESEEKRSFLSTPKFVPNFETNVVFVMSVLQGTWTALFFHKGKPFYPSILESRQLCRWSALSVVFAVACILETFPFVNAKLELRPWGSTQQKLYLLGLVTLDALACAAVEWVFRMSVYRKMDETKLQGPVLLTTEELNRTGKTTAADEEEKLLRLESKTNLNFLVKLVFGVVFMIFHALHYSS